MIIAECIQNCTLMTDFHFSIFKEWNLVSGDPQKKWIECISSSTISKK